ncbi:wax ester/triacylglycerol synthase family O-acyltransferase [Nocardioides panacisoli]|uniref:WS/DGAT/MGAT family O-acyltransferase n=1 Tax=Nocardioides panacisoli TaxID=627624 RepID=UPI001C627D29|nr:wax ester/triacylglycerol synthase family O-acyltransferase [Nocardioides panacisoli]QYJ02433.1 wax ester/triacylglycerol synthase family O-acyltransferase [Nocardioides panacisoli]
MDRVHPRDLAFLIEETSETPRHNASIEVFEPGDDGFDYQDLIELIRDRIGFVPRYRQRIQGVPGRVANPVWVDDEHFDLGYHVRRSALPRPGTMDQLRDLSARIVSRPLDRDRPLWEIYFIEGLENGRIALLSKSHQALVDGVHTVDLGQLLLDHEPGGADLEPDDWRPRPTPSPAALLGGAVRDTVGDHAVRMATVRRTAQVLRREAEGRTQGLQSFLQAAVGRKPRHKGIINGPLSRQRRVLTVDTELADYRRIRDAHGGTVNDAILATLTGAIRSWLMARSESLSGFNQIRTLVPVSVIDDEMPATSLGSQIAPHFVELPVGEASPVVRLHQVSYSFKAHKETGRGVAARRLAGLSGFAPSTFHAIGARVSATELRHGYQLSVTNVPGPQEPVYAAGARLVSSYPVPPVMPGHPVVIGVTSYDGGVRYGITVDRDWIPDPDLLATGIGEALDELLEVSTSTRARRGRSKR